MVDVHTEIARGLREMRLRRGWSCEDLAQKAGLSPDEIEAYEADPASLSQRVMGQVLEAMALHPADRPFPDPVTPFPAVPPARVINEMEVRMLELEAALRIDQRDFPEALEQLEHALALCLSPERTGRLLLSKAAVLAELGRDERALKTLHEAERRLDRRREPALWLRLRLEQMYLTCQAERSGEAAAWLEETRKLAAQVGGDRERLQVRCLEGWIAAGSGQTQKALRLLQPVCAELMAEGKAPEATGIALDVAGLLTEQGNLDEVAELARRIEALMKEKKFPPGAGTTLKVFCRSVHQGTLTPERSRKLAIELRKVISRLPRPYELPV